MLHLNAFLDRPNEEANFVASESRRLSAEFMILCKYFTVFFKLKVPKVDHSEEGTYLDSD